MSYSVEWHHKARKFLKKLPDDISARIVIKVKEVQRILKNQQILKIL